MLPLSAVCMHVLCLEVLPSILDGEESNTSLSNGQNAHDSWLPCLLQGYAVKAGMLVGRGGAVALHGC